MGPQLRSAYCQLTLTTCNRPKEDIQIQVPSFGDYQELKTPRVFNSNVLKIGEPETAKKQRKLPCAFNALETPRFNRITHLSLALAILRNCCTV